MLDFVLPNQCVGCGLELKFGALCPRCQKTLVIESAARCPRCTKRLIDGLICLSCRKELVFTRLAVAIKYSHPIARAAIDALKFEGIKALARPLAQILAQALESQIAFSTKINLVAMPLYKKRLAQRGFNQTMILAEALAAEFKTSALEILRENLERIRHTDQQARLAREARVLNVQDAFRVNDSNAIAGRNILLVDDVITTGATMAWAASALKKAGAREVWACAVAQG